MDPKGQPNWIMVEADIDIRESLQKPENEWAFILFIKIKINLIVVKKFMM